MNRRGGRPRIDLFARALIIQSLPRIPPGQRYQMNVVCHMLYVVHLGLLVPSWGCIGRTLGPPGSTLGLSWAMSGPSWDHFGRSWEVLGHTLGFRVYGLGFWQLNAYPFEMQKSRSPYACAAKTLAWKTKMFSSIETTYLRNMPSSLSHYTCAANSLSGHAADRKKVITDIQNH